jgi:oligopeptide transport system permease protein
MTETPFDPLLPGLRPEQAERVGPVAVGRSQLRNGFARMLRNRAAVAGMIVMALIVLVCVAGPWVIPFNAVDPDFESVSVPPSLSTGHFFGTDELGRDLLARTLSGGRTSLLIGVSATIVCMIIGVLYGATAGFLGGVADSVMMRIVDILYALPFLFLVIMLTMLFGRGFLSIFIAIGAVFWLTVSVIVRGQTLGLKQKEFIEAARAGGMRPFEIVLRHIVPNTIGPVIVYASLTVPEVILGESFLSFLGLGVQEPDTSWGALINDATAAMETSPWQLLFPALFLAATLFSLNFIADGLRDAFDPKDR